MSGVTKKDPKQLIESIERLVLGSATKESATLIKKNKRLQMQRDVWRERASFLRAKLLERGEKHIPGDWKRISSAPRSEDFSFIVFIPVMDHPEGGYELQVTRFEGNLYPDHLESNVNHEDVVKGATHWRRRDPPPIK